MIPGLLGAVTGIFGSLITSGLKIWEKKLALQEMEVKHKHEINLLQEQAKMRASEMEHESVLADLKAWMETRTASYTHDANYHDTKLQWVRPGITALLYGLVGVFWFSIGDIVTPEGLSMKNMVVFAIVDYAGMATAWWFGDRGMKVSTPRKS